MPRGGLLAKSTAIKYTFAFILLCPCCFRDDANEPQRPHIPGIAGVRIHVSAKDVVLAFYSKYLEPLQACLWCETDKPDLPIAYSPFRDQFVVLDCWTPLHLISFVQAAKKPYVRKASDPHTRIIHAGFIVRDRAAEDKFYADILGFHIYWHGGMKDDRTDWIDMQVPHGSDWIEYMLNVSPNADQHLRGIMNHFAIGVPDIEAAAYRIHKNGMNPSEEPKIDRDGKWQLNLYDPHPTHVVELMEFTPVEKPCCS